MQSIDTSWKKDGDWKKRYSLLYSSLVAKRPQDDRTSCISFMGNDFQMPHSSFLGAANLGPSSELSLKSRSITLMSPYSISDHSRSVFCRNQSEDLGGHETLLLNMVRAKTREFQEEAEDQPLDLPREEENHFGVNEACMHGLNMRYPERSVSRSRVSRMSTRRDMDIQSILAYSASLDQPAHLEIPAFQNVNPVQREDPFRWSIRKSVCPVCSQKWKDRSNIKKIKYSGLKRNSSVDLPSVIAPARLRSSITQGYIPRPAQFIIDEDAGGLRNSIASSWKLIRARRLHIPKQQLPPEATAPPAATAPLAQKDLQTRVLKFLSEEME